MTTPNHGAETPLPQGPQLDDFLSPRVRVLPESDHEQFTYLGDSRLSQGVPWEVDRLGAYVSRRLREVLGISLRQAKDIIRCTMVGVCQYFYNTRSGVPAGAASNVGNQPTSRMITWVVTPGNLWTTTFMLVLKQLAVQRPASSQSPYTSQEFGLVRDARNANTEDPVVEMAEEMENYIALEAEERLFTEARISSEGGGAGG